jgi:hypothetical protein
MATYYWVGGGGTWDTSSANWSLTDGGAGGAGVPTIADDAVFYPGSGTGTVTLTNDSVCRYFYHGFLSSKSEIAINIPFGVTFTCLHFYYLSSSRPVDAAILTINGSLITSRLEFNFIAQQTIFGSGTIIHQIVSGSSWQRVWFWDCVEVQPSLVLNRGGLAEITSDNNGITFTSVTASSGTVFFRYVEYIIGSLSITNATLQFNSSLTSVVNELSITDGTLTSSSATLQAGLSVTGSADIRGTTITRINSGTVIKVINSTDGGGNTNILFVDRPFNLSTVPTTLTNKTTSTSSIINLDTDPSSLTNL